jgi:hypothetical protein
MTRLIVVLALAIGALFYGGCERFTQKKAADSHAGETAAEHAAHSHADGSEHHEGETAEEHAAHEHEHHEGESKEEHEKHDDGHHEGESKEEHEKHEGEGGGSGK